MLKKIIRDIQEKRDIELIGVNLQPKQKIKLI